ncbi:DUF5665 domain-containing protein [Paenibacillus agricola]|uniref:Signal transduction histidine kinase n=1 Tax=Paenibacillus agricola TaxID=2716264 RepID=A0ABX0J1G6_9BACL|nr:DUF5665 domain-containing protein [Paenibacillus agricola]NHN28633.1 hypothetical protein [Paenibacillus agricola]
MSGHHPLPDRKLMESIHQQVTKIANHMERTQIADYVNLLNSPRKLILSNLLAGLSRGVGIAIGFTIFATTILYALQLIGALNLPIIGDYIADIIKHVQYQLEGRTF